MILLFTTTYYLEESPPSFVYPLLLVLVISFSLVGLLMFFAFLKKSYRYIRIKSFKKNSKFQSLKPGFVALQGRIIQAENIITTPASKEPCVYYEYHKEVYVYGRKGYSWNPEVSNIDQTPFILESSGKHITIFPKRVNFFSDIKKTYWSKQKEKPSKNRIDSFKEEMSQYRKRIADVRNYLSSGKMEALNISVDGMTLLAPGERYPSRSETSIGDQIHQERYISIGNTIFVIGKLSRNKQSGTWELHPQKRKFITICEGSQKLAFRKLFLQLITSFIVSIIFLMAGLGMYLLLENIQSL